MSYRWELYHDLHAVCKDMGVGPSVAMTLACALDLLGVTSLADMGNVSSGKLMRFHGVGRKCAQVAVALGARDELGVEVDA